MHDDRLTHATTCPAPMVRELPGRLGDPMIRCDNCRRFRFLGDVPHVPTATTPPRLARPAPARAGVIPPYAGGPKRDGAAWPSHRSKSRNSQRGTRHR